MRILIKGGVWKNTEDEILKAAVMKYGKNQWARVASLMNRKNSKQCKARWYEWLDPSIKKTEWNKEEEEKLLHMAKLMPNQWRTIAPIVGRTAPQCMEHYERLLDQAQEGNEGVLDDTRRLRPGEIDPAPETKPARPDPIDMDEDEKEMLSEARARLANTKGKKAKRKARERQLEESRRLSMLQKRRELKAAGIESKLGGGGKRKYINYAKEIPFQKVPPAGFYDVGEETAAGNKQFIDPVKHGLELSRMEGKHQKEEEDREKQKDKKRLKTLFAANAPQAIMSISNTNDPTALRRRSALALPAPQVSESELEDIVKQGQRSLMPPPSEGKSSTQALVGDYASGHGGLYSSTPAAPQRTPLQENMILQEARNLRALREITPFTAAQTEDELPDISFLQGGTGFESIKPRDNTVATPNMVLRTPQTDAGGGGGAGLGGGSSVVSSSRGGTSRATPQLRDQFGLNEWQAKSLAVGGTPAHSTSTPMTEYTNDNSDAFSVSDISMTSEISDRKREKLRKMQLAEQLKSLPEPEYSYDVTLPQLEEDEEDVSMDKPVDEADRLRQDAAVLQAEESAKQQRRSQVLQRSLPRPAAVNPLLAQGNGSALLLSSEDENMIISSAIGNELVQLVGYENFVYPISTKSSGKRNKHESSRAVAVELEDIDDEYLAAARELVQEETAAVLENIVERNGAEISHSETGVLSVAEYALAWEEQSKQLVYVANPQGTGGSYRPAGNVSKAELLSSLEIQYQALKTKLDKDGKKCAKLEQKIGVKSQGYLSIADKVAAGLRQSLQEVDNRTIELACYRTLRDSEVRAISRRVAAARKDLSVAEGAEALYQKRYAEVLAGDTDTV